MAGGDSNAFKAFVDASAGAMGALISGVLLYPLDVAKTRKQVEVQDDEKDKQPANQAITKTDHKSQGSMWMICWMIYQADGVQGLFAGLSSKVVHTLFANFAYFYWYSFLKQAAERHSQKTITTGMNLLVASLAGALNMSMTLPLEMINTRAQTQSTDEDDEINDASQSSKQPPAHHKKKSMWELSQEIYAEDGLLSFWKGYIPSLVLVSNPAINYTAFDKLKLRLQESKMAASGSKRLSSLTMWEAFVLGAIAKAIATIMTYPVIRAKVLMQAQKKHHEAAPTSSTTTHHHRHHADMGDSMVQVLKRIGELEGPTGYFKGCSAQLFNTVLKSAFLLMTKEQITKYTMRVLYSLRRTGESSLPAAKA